jgi:SpoVK/Ycf46/Vps4 family AAA+-type ATPase
MAKANKSDLPKEYQELWDELIMPVDTNISFDSVILSDENKEKYKAFIKEQQYRDVLYEYGLEPMNRLLLYGASGTGKTFSLKALSNLLDYTMVYVDIAKALTDGNVAKNISNIFKLGNYIAEHYDGAIIFLDECDAVAWNRDGGGDGGVLRRATNSIFQGLDQMSHHAVFAAATNMLHRLDPAFERRFNLKMAFRRPSLDIDECIKHFIYPKFIINDDVDETVREIVKRRAKQYAKLSYYEIEELVKRAMKRSILNDTSIVNTSDIYEDLATAMNFKIKMGTALDDEKIFHNDNNYEPS